MRHSSSCRWIRDGLPGACECGLIQLRDAACAMLGDHQTSEAHHPEHVLVRREHFRMLLEAICGPEQEGKLMVDTQAFVAAKAIVNSEPVLSVYAACEWEELSDDGKQWIAAIVAAAQTRVGA